MPAKSTSHLILIPSYNTGVKLESTVRSALAQWSPVWVVVDGSNDGSDQCLNSLQLEFPDALHVIRLANNQGKGEAVLVGVEEALAAGYTHVLTMDSDGQHATASIPDFMNASRQNPRALILGKPVFDASAPCERLLGRMIANTLANTITFGGNIGDCLFGFRVYPTRDLVDVMLSTVWARRFDFDPEVAVRLVWHGLPVLNLPTPCQYFKPSEGGVSHFNYLRDNVLLTGMYFRLVIGALIRLPELLFRRLSAK